MPCNAFAWGGERAGTERASCIGICRQWLQAHNLRSKLGHNASNGKAPCARYINHMDTYIHIVFASDAGTYIPRTHTYTYLGMIPYPFFAIFRRQGEIERRTFSCGYFDSLKSYSLDEATDRPVGGFIGMLSWSDVPGRRGMCNG